MLHRVRARVRYPASSGLATWSRDQMAVRHGQAVHINEGAANEEAPANEVVDLGDDTHLFRCDLPLMDEAHAADALATLTADSVFSQALAIPDYMGGESPSWVEHHTCDHDEEHRTGCIVVAREEHPAP